MRYYTGDERTQRRLKEEWRGKPTYRLVNMEVWLKKPWVPHALRDAVDMSDAETERVFRRALMTPSQLKSKGAQFIVLPVAIYQRYLGEYAPPGQRAARVPIPEESGLFRAATKRRQPHCRIGVRRRG